MGIGTEQTRPQRVSRVLCVLGPGPGRRARESVHARGAQHRDRASVPARRPRDGGLRARLGPRGRVFSTPPAHKGLGTPGSEALAELAVTHRARLVVCGGAPGTTLLGRTLVVAPGRLTDGSYAVADLHSRTAEFSELSVSSS